MFENIKCFKDDKVMAHSRRCFYRFKELYEQGQASPAKISRR